jgi:hypothetical protein
MDKIKPYLDLLKKHHFWPLAALVALIGVYAWFSGTAAYDAEFVRNRGVITGAFGQLQTIGANPPNASFTQRLQEFQNKQIQSTLAAWQTLYDQQKDVLKWSFAHDRLAHLKPDEEIPEGVRQMYVNYFRGKSGVFPKLFETVKPLRRETVAEPANAAANQRQPNLAQRAAAQQQRKQEEKWIGIVEWPDSERDAIVARYDWEKAPTSTQVRVAQEDYWVYKALLEAIAETNNSVGANTHHNAAIKRIDRLAIAQAALDDPRVAIDFLPNEARPTGESPQNQPKPVGPKSTDEELLAGRYATPQVSDAGTADSSSSEYRLVPMTMRLRMDERRIPNLLVACANSSLPIEVQQVLYNPEASTPGAPGGGMPMTVGARPGGSGQKGETRSASEIYDATIEVRGIVYIFNPPSKEALGIVEEPVSEPETAPAVAPPAAAAPTPTEPVPAEEPPAEASEAAPAAEGESTSSAAAEGETSPPSDAPQSEAGPPREEPPQ